MKQNAAEGKRREDERNAESVSKFGKDNVLMQKMLLDVNGKKVVDPVTGIGRRIDEYIKCTGKCTEVTSLLARKLEQTQREQNIRYNGGVFIRDPATGKLIDTGSEPSDLDRRP